MKYNNLKLLNTISFAAMIAWLGILAYKSGCRMKVEKADIDPYERTDDVQVNWR